MEVIGKYILVRMAEDHRMLPPEVIHQKKVGAVDAPVEEWYGGPLRPVLDELFKALPFTADDAYLRALLRPKLAERGYAYLLARYTNNITSITLAPSLLATLAPFSRVARQPA